jgi:hypothetical protein
MRKLQTVLLALLAVFAFGATLSASASAETTLVAEWLAGAGLKITTNLASETSGSILEEDEGAGPGAVLCSAILVGTVGTAGKGVISEVLNLAEEKVGELPAGLALVSPTDCTNVLACEAAEIAVRPVGLPWTTQLFLMESGAILDLVVGASYDLVCLVLKIKIEDTCAAADSEVEVLNDPEHAAVPALAKFAPNANCTIGGAGKGVNEIDELTFITLVSGELLAVSSE